MTTHTTSADDTSSAPARLERMPRIAAIAAGFLFGVEAVASPVVDSHVGYHLPNAVLNACLFVVCIALVRLGRRVIGTVGMIGGGVTAFAALLAALGGLDVVIVEAVGSGAVGDVVDGIAHTAVLLSLLSMVPLGLGLRRMLGRPAVLISVTSATMVAMVLAGLDDPEMFLLPELLLGAGWVSAGSAASAPIVAPAAA